MNKKEINKSLIHFVGIAEFDEDTGTVMRGIYPTNPVLGDYTLDYFAELSVPEGGHLHETDTSFIIAKIDDEVLYGLAHFRKIADTTMKRGSRQASCIVVARQPHYDQFLPFLEAGVNRFLDRSVNDSTLLQTLYEALSETSEKSSVGLWGKNYLPTFHTLKEDEFGDTSLTRLVQLFGTDTMILWYALLRQERIFFSGISAKEIGNCCLACPLLVAPITGFTNIICPHLPLILFQTKVDTYTNKETNIVGVLNMLFEGKEQLYDVLATFRTAIYIIHRKGVKVLGHDKQFMKSVINGINDRKSEQWVRDQFRNYTEQFLENLFHNILIEQQKKLLGASSDRPFAKTEMFSRCVKRKTQDSNSSVQKPIAIYNQLISAEAKQKVTLLQQLSSSLQNIADIETVIDADGVATLTKFIQQGNSTERKYAVIALASIAVTMRGQISILSEQVLSLIIEMIKNPSERLNVKTVACQFLHNISSSYIGAKESVDRGVTDVLAQIVCSEGDAYDLNLIGNAAQTLLQINRILPNRSPEYIPSFIKHLSSADISFVQVLLQLLDIWGVDVQSYMTVSKDVATKLAKLSATVSPNILDIPTRHAACITLQATLSQTAGTSSSLLLELIKGGAISYLWQNVQKARHKQSLCADSFDILGILATTHFGAQTILSNDIIKQTIEVVRSSKEIRVLFHSLRFLEIVCQQKILCKNFIDNKGVQTLVSFIQSTITQRMRLLCVPALGALRYLIRFSCERFQDIRKNIIPLKTTFLEYSPDDRRTQELQKMMHFVLYLTKLTDIPMQEEIVMNEFYQTLDRRYWLFDAPQTPRKTVGNVPENLLTLP
eukprot:c21702_g1_i2.p1 GENE.c21702_g1_i2~~c21702_g1_i2.p1  ORF type:complete len:833 (-),score=303.07 c21702_g1_i2:74-2572(-)